MATTPRTVFVGPEEDVNAGYIAGVAILGVVALLLLIGIFILAASNMRTMATMNLDMVKKLGGGADDEDAEEDDEGEEEEDEGEEEEDEEGEEAGQDE